MIVRLDLERNGEPVADINDAGVFFAGADQDFLRLGWEGFEQWTSVFVGTMLAPHHREDAEFGVVWFAAEDFLDTREFVRRQVVFLDQLGSNRWLGH